MSGPIKDGTGTGNWAKVDDHGRLWVSANIVDHKQHHALYHKNLYIANFDTVLPDNNATVIAFFKNLDSTKDFEIYDVEVSSNATVELNWYFDADYTSGGAAVEPVNSNRGSGKTLPVTTAVSYEGGASGDIVLDTASAVKFHTHWLEANRAYTEGFDGCLVFANDTSASMTATGSVGDKVSVTVYMAYHDSGTVL